MQTAFDAELVRCIPELRRYARKLTRNAADAEDLTQECLTRALSRSQYFQPGTNMVAWLRTILKNQHYNNYHRSKRRSDIELLDGDTEVSPAQIYRLMLRDVKRALAQLSPDQLKVVGIIALDGVPYHNAAKQLGVPVGTIRSRLCRARQQLRASVLQ